MCKPREVLTVRYAGREGLQATLYLQYISQPVNSGNAFSALDAGEMRGMGRGEKIPSLHQERDGTVRYKVVWVSATARWSRSAINLGECVFIGICVELRPLQEVAWFEIPSGDDG